MLDDDGRDVPGDGETIGEIAVSGNDVMLGYYRDDEATKIAVPCLRRELAEGSLPGPNSAGRPPYRPEGVAR